MWYIVFGAVGSGGGRGDELEDSVEQGEVVVGVGEVVMRKRHHCHSAEREQFSVLKAAMN